MHGLEGKPNHSATNASWNADLAPQSIIDSKVPRNLEQTLFSLEDSFWYILNNPICYNEIIWRFFDKNNLFCMFPHVEAFLKTYRLTGNANNIQPTPPPNSKNNIIRSSPSSNP